jgi:hypothetical protein
MPFARLAINSLYRSETQAEPINWATFSALWLVCRSPCGQPGWTVEDVGAGMVTAGDSGVALRGWRALQSDTTSPFKHELCHRFAGVAVQRFLLESSERVLRLSGRWSPAYLDSLGGCWG